MREVAGMVPVITHAVTNRLLLVRDVIYVLQNAVSNGVVLDFRIPSEGALPIAQQRTTEAYTGKFEREVKE